MKPSKKNSIKVAVTINQESMPQWYEFLKNIDSGHVRAAVLRAHLKHPGDSTVFKQQRLNTPLPQQEQTAESIGETALESRSENTAPPATPAGLTSTVPPPSRGGLASAMLRSGQAPRW